MAIEPIILEPVFKERIWGGTRLREDFGFDIPSDSTGECWAVSAHPAGPCRAVNPPWAGMTLLELWKERRDLFGGLRGDGFPLLVKILDARDDLSVQVHPGDEAARAGNGEESGKSECWYIIDCTRGASIILGHNARTRGEFEAMASAGEWDRLLRRVPIKPGDFHYIPSGTIHALCSGALVLETQQSSDLTYRIYDWDRRDRAGTRRDLHLEKALAAARFPYVDADERPETIRRHGGVTTVFTRNGHFTLSRQAVSGSMELPHDEPFLILGVISGEGSLGRGAGSWPLRKGSHLVLPHGFGRFRLNGTLCAMVSSPGRPGG
ncbi:MAG: mannose-6-phosphate isomerase, class I [Spirochaetes bacterium]|nr:mannose-6-phosphate isomerase, class I [Spirochaetota bacterium]